MDSPVIGIIGGKGRMGRLFADFFKEKGVNVLIADQKTKLSNKDLAAKADITIVSVPIEKTEKVIKEVLLKIKKDSAIMDFTSLKEFPIQAMLKGKAEVLGLHPMFGDSNPIPNQTVIACPTKKSGKWSAWMIKFLKKHKVKIIEMTAKEHDKIMNNAQGLIHFADITFADALRRNQMPVKELLKYTSKASELKVMLAARLIDQDAGLYGNMQIANKNTLKSLKEYKKSVDDLIKIVKKKDFKSFKKYFQKNKNFLGSYAPKAYKESSGLIDKIVAKEKPKQSSQKISKNSIALLGPKNTFSDIAATDYLKATNSELKKYYAKNIEEIFDLVEKGKVKEGIAPIENKTHGTERESLDLLFHRKVHITHEINIKVHHSFITMSHAKKSDIRKIISHSQALNQCKKYLKKNFPKAEVQALSSTAAAIERLISSNDKSLAVIAPELAGQESQLKIMDKTIEDEQNNSTTFIVVRKGKTAEQKNSTKTSIAFHFDSDSPGSLFTVFKDFSDAKINMSKIESRPTKAKFGDYIFYLDFDGSLSSAKIKNTLKKVEKKVAKLKILGSY